MNVSAVGSLREREMVNASAFRPPPYSDLTNVSAFGFLEERDLTNVSGGSPRPGEEPRPRTWVGRPKKEMSSQKK